MTHSSRLLIRAAANAGEARENVPRQPAAGETEAGTQDPSVRRSHHIADVVLPKLHLLHVLQER